MKKTLTSFLKIIGKIIPLGVIVFVYQTICKIPFLKGGVAGLMRLVIPESITLEGATLMLNQDDVVVSGSLALNFYEGDEIQIFKNVLSRGMTVFDVGANIGLYSVIAAQKVGPTGRVYAFEPDPTNFSFLKKNVAANKFSHLIPVQKAVTNISGDVRFFLSEDNLGDHSLYDTEQSRDSISVSGVSLNDFVKQYGIAKIDVLKIDVQGAEGQAFEGMSDILSSKNAPKLFMEVYPYGLLKMHTNPLELLRRLEGYGYELSLIDTRLHKIDNLEEVVGKISGKGYVNIFAEKL